MKTIFTKKYDLSAQSNSMERAKEDKRRVKKITSPDTSKMIELKVPELRCTFYFKTAKRRNLKIRQLKTAGII